MGRIQSTIGLITGLPIQDTVDQLMKIEARPRDLVVSRTKALQAQQTAVTELTAKVLAVQFAARRLGNASVFDKKTATSSAPDLLAVAVTGQPPAGNYQITPVQTAQSHQLLSSGFASRTEPLGAGQFSFRYGRTVNDGLALSDLNGGDGVERGKIRITDRSGASSVVDLRFAQTVDDVIQAINSTDGVNVTASVVGDRIQLVDETGQTTTNLKVQEVNGDQTAADLGLAGIDAAANQAQGSDVLRLHQGLALASLNDGAGVDLSDTLSDLEVNLRDGTTLSIDFHRLARPEDFAHATTSAAGGENARVTLTAKQKGAAHDDVRIIFVDDAGVTQGNETVVYDESDPDNKTLTVHIDAGQTTAADVAAAISGDATAGALFTAAAEGDGQGVVDGNDTAVTLGGAALAARKEATLGDLIATINEADPTRLRAELSPDGDRLILTDLSADAGGTFEVANPLDHRTAEHLGLARSAAGNTITGSRLLGGLKTSLLSSLNGGRGFALGQLNLTDRSGASDTVDLSSAETLEDVINTINASGVSVTAAINSARTGLVLTDTSGGSGDLTIADGDATNTAQKLQIAVDDAVSTVNSGSLDLQVISRQTTLDSLNGGKGVAAGSFLIFNSNGLAKTFNPGTANLKTVGDLIDKINDASLGIKARINDAGDGIALIDTVGGAQSLRVQEVGSGTVARDLHLLGTGTTTTDNGNPAQIIQGSTTTTITIDDDDTLNDLVAKINNSGGAVTASVFSSGSGSLPHRLSLLSSTPGLAGRLVVDASAAGFELNETAAARDALLVYGSSSNGAGVLVSSSQDTFSSLIDGLSVTVKGAAANPVTVSVASTDSDVVGAVKTFIEQYNALQTKLEEVTFFNETDQSVGVLFGSHETLRIENDLANLVTGRFFGAGSIQSLAEVGIQVGDDGKLQLDETKLKAKFAADPQGVEEFFAKEDLGVADKFDRLIETLAGANSSLLVDRAGALAVKIELGLSRVDFLNERLTRERERMLKQFYDMETAIGKLQNNLTALNQLQVLPPLTSVR